MRKWFQSMRVYMQGPAGTWLGWGLVIATLGTLYHAEMMEHVQWASDPHLIDTDAVQQIAPFHRYADPASFPKAYAGNYFLDCLPWGYRGIYTIAGYADRVVEFSKSLPFAEFLWIAVCMTLAAYRFGGFTGAGFAGALTLGSGLVFSRVEGGLPRSFAMPFLAAAILCLTYGRIQWLLFLIPLAAAFYPVAGVLIGITATLILFILPRADRGDATDWPFRKRVTLLLCAAIAAGLVLLPTLLSSKKHGEVIKPSQSLDFPEVGSNGRYGPESRAPFPGFLETANDAFSKGITGGGPPWLSAPYEWGHHRQRYGLICASLMALALVGWFGHACSRSDARRIWILVVASFIGYSLACPLAPHLYVPQRYIVYPIPLLAILFTATCVGGYGTFLRHRSAGQLLRPAFTLILASFVLLTIGARGHGHDGMTRIRPVEANILQEISQLPKDSLIAGWPLGIINYVSYVSRRQIFVSYELHQAFHTHFTLEMRRRMNALIDAYFATSVEPIQTLQRDFGVTHIIVDRQLFTRPPNYFEPFKDRLNSAWTHGAGNFELERIARHQAPSSNRLVVINIQALHTP